MNWEQLQRVLDARSRAVADLLRLCSKELNVRGSDWSSAEVGAHLVSVPRRYLRMMELPEPFPESLSAVNEAEIVGVGCDDMDQLAEMLVSDVNGLVRHLGADGSRIVPFFGMKLAAEDVGAVMLGELLLHGLDLARTLNRPWEIAREEAGTVLRGLLPTAGSSLVDTDVAARAAGTYHLRIRRCHDWTIEVRGGAATVDEGRPSRADLRISADPLAFLLVGYGRASRLRALVTGRMLGWGRRPLLAAPFSKLFTET